MQPLLCAQGKAAGSLGSAGLQELLLMLLALRLDPIGQLLAVEIQVTPSPCSLTQVNSDMFLHWRS